MGFRFATVGRRHVESVAAVTHRRFAGRYEAGWAQLTLRSRYKLDTAAIHSPETTWHRRDGGSGRARDGPVDVDSDGRACQPAWMNG